jgi:glycosyltransferase involved in cell wall biosynthesis
MIPKLSVIIPVYNAKNWIAGSIASVLRERSIDLELIVVDDGSTDGTQGVVRELAKVDQRILFIENSLNMGVSNAMNRGIQKSNGLYVARMDADDEYIEGWLSRQLSYMERHLDCDVLGGWMFRIRKKGDVKLRKYPEFDEDLKLMLFFECCFSHSTIMFRRSVLEGMDYVYDVNYKSAEDYELWARMSLTSKFHCLQEPAIYRRELDTGLSSVAKSTGIRAQLLRKIVKGLFDNHGLSEADYLFHQRILDNELSSNDHPRAVRIHLNKIFSLFPAAKNKNQISKGVLRKLYRNPFFLIRDIFSSKGCL